MIFKYFSYDKKLKDWHDTKIYCSVCIPGQLPKAKELTSVFFNILTKHKLITMPPEYFSVQDQSTFPGVRTYTVSHLTASKRTSVGKLTQLPDKANAPNNAKIKSSWSEGLFIKSIPSNIRNVASANYIIGGWGDPPGASMRAQQHRARAPRINALFNEPQAAAEPAVAAAVAAAAVAGIAQPVPLVDEPLAMAYIPEIEQQQPEYPQPRAYMPPPRNIFDDEDFLFGDEDF